MATREQIFGLVDKVKDIIGLLDEERLRYKKQCADLQKQEKNILAHDEGAQEVYEQWGNFLRKLATDNSKQVNISGEDYVIMLSVNDLYKIARQCGYKGGK